MDLNSSYGETELTPDDKECLKLKKLKTKRDIDIAENENIQKAGDKLVNMIFSNKLILDYIWLKELHNSMFGEVWEWAGKYRKRLTNIGVAPEQISVQMDNLCKDILIWLEMQSYPIEEIVIRFHHISTKIHPFPNGNGRWSRLASMCLANANGIEIDWEKLFIQSQKDEYIKALQIADYSYDYDKLNHIMKPIFKK